MMRPPDTLPPRTGFGDVDPQLETTLASLRHREVLAELEVSVTAGVLYGMEKDHEDFESVQTAFNRNVRKLADIRTKIDVAMVQAIRG